MRALKTIKLQTINVKKFFSVSNMKNLDRVTSFTKFDV